MDSLEPETLAVLPDQVKDATTRDNFTRLERNGRMDAIITVLVLMVQLGTISVTHFARHGPISHKDVSYRNRQVNVVLPHHARVPELELVPEEPEQEPEQVAP